MKTTNRASRKAGKKAVSAQSPNTTENNTGETPKETLTLCIQSGLPKEDIAQMKLPDDLALYFRRCVADENPNLGAFVIMALREKMLRDKIKWPGGDLESAVQRALVTMDSANAKITEYHIDEMSPRSPGFNQRVCDTVCGYQTLFYETGKALHLAYEASISYMNPNGI